MSKYLNSRERKIFFVCALSVIAAVIYNGLFVPLQEKENALDQEIVIQKEMHNSELNIIEKAKGYQNRYEHYVEQFQKPGTTEEAASSVLSEIGQVAGELGLSVTVLKPGQVRHNALDNYMTVNLTLKSGLLKIVRFLYTIQQSPYSVTIEKMELDQSARRGQSVITAHLTLGKVFILSETDQKRDNDQNGQIQL